ncbi:MAG: HEAT repeat domain-containing protein [Saprospiraceae bacterium]|nr:HEAT repeat domain-containing protein [Saprospiraceae bacterium]
MIKQTFYAFKILLLCLYVLIGKPIFAQELDSLKKLPALQEMRQPKIDVKHIALDLSFDWQKKQTFGTATLTLSVLNDAPIVALDAAKMTIKSVKIGQGKSLKFDYEGGEKDENLKIYLDKTYKHTENILLNIEYHTLHINEPDPNSLGGSTGKGLRFFQPTFTEPRKRRQIWSMAEGESNRYWFPCHDVLTDFRTTELKATVDKNLTVISNGNLIKIQENPNNTRTFHWKMVQPYANYQTSIVVGEYVEIKQEVNLNSAHNPQSPNPKNTEGVLSLRTYAYPDEVEATKASIVQLPEMLRFFYEKTGIKYPYPSYSQVFVQDLPWGMWNTSTSTLTENMVDDYGTHADYLYLWDDLAAEALAVQWFGSLITPADWQHNWLNRAFARYFSGLYDEYKNGRQEYISFPHQWDINTYLFDWNNGHRRPIVTNNFTDKTAFISDNYGIFRGAAVLHTLRQELGEEKWWKAIRYYTRKHAQKSVTTDDFIKAIEATTGEKIGWFFDQWVYKMGHPIFDITKKYDAENKQLLLVIKQVQKQDTTNAYPQVQYFKGKMAIEIDDKIETIWIESIAEKTYIFNCSQEPKLVHFDYETAWIKELKFEKSLAELLYQFQHDKDIMGRRSAMQAIAAIFKKETSTADEKAKIHEAFRKVLSSNVYWRFKFMSFPVYQGLLAAKQPVVLDKITSDFLISAIKNEKAWVRNAAINCLSITNDPQYADLYIGYLNDSSDRVINAAAIALGKTKSPKAFDALAQLKDKPSWKNQSLISTLYALKELQDPRGVDIALAALKDSPAAPRWTLAVPVWDFRIAAAETLVALGKNTEGYPIVAERFKKSLEENDVNDIFNNVLIISILADPRGQAVFDELKIKYKDDVPILNAVNQFEQQFKEHVGTK